MRADNLDNISRADNDEDDFESNSQSSVPYFITVYPSNQNTDSKTMIRFINTTFITTL